MTIDVKRLRELIDQATSDPDEARECLRCHVTYSVLDGYEPTPLCMSCTVTASDEFIAALRPLLDVYEAACVSLDCHRRHDSTEDECRNAELRFERAVDAARGAKNE